MYGTIFWIYLLFAFQLDIFLYKVKQTFLQGINGFEEMKRYTRSGTDFGREIVAALSER